MTLSASSTPVEGSLKPHVALEAKRSTPEALSFRRSPGGMTGLCLMFSLPSFFWTFGIEHFIRRLKGFAFCYFHASIVWRVVKENLSIAFLMVSNEEP